MIFKTRIWKQPLGGILKINDLKTAERQPAALLITSGEKCLSSGLFLTLNFIPVQISKALSLSFSERKLFNNSFAIQVLHLGFHRS